MNEQKILSPATSLTKGDKLVLQIKHKKYLLTSIHRSISHWPQYIPNEEELYLIVRALPHRISFQRFLINLYKKDGLAPNLEELKKLADEDYLDAKFQVYRWITDQM